MESRYHSTSKRPLTSFRLPRHRLREALEATTAEPSLIWTNLKIHDWACMRLRLCHHETSKGSTNGVRQGCGLGPSLWVLYTCLILRALQPSVPTQCITAFADDLLLQWRVSTPQQFHQVCKDIGFVLRTPEQFGMRISTDKTDPWTARHAGQQADRTVHNPRYQERQAFPGSK